MKNVSLSKESSSCSSTVVPHSSFGSDGSLATCKIPYQKDEVGQQEAEGEQEEGQGPEEEEEEEEAEEEEEEEGQAREEIGQGERGRRWRREDTPGGEDLLGHLAGPPERESPGGRRRRIRPLRVPRGGLAGVLGRREGPHQSVRAQVLGERTWVPREVPVRVSSRPGQSTKNRK